MIAAREVGTHHEHAAAYLQTTTLSEAVAASRKGGKGARRVVNPIRKNDHPTLWAALSGGNDEAKGLAEEVVAAAVKRAEDWLFEHTRGGFRDAG